jgi:Arc/MetJ family transcription regulator
MRTTLDLPEDLLKEAMRLSKTRTKTSTVILSLQELINKRKIERLRALKGKLDLDVDLDVLRRDRTAP